MKKKSATKALFVVSLLVLLALGLVVPGLAQDQINLTDGLHELHWNGIGSTHVSLLIPSHYCSGGTCTIAQAPASGTGNLAADYSKRSKLEMSDVSWIRPQGRYDRLYLGSRKPSSRQGNDAAST